MITPETCPHKDELCSECSSGQDCHPVIVQKGGVVQRTMTKRGPKLKRFIPAWLADASASVRRSYGY